LITCRTANNYGRKQEKFILGLMRFSDEFSTVKGKKKAIPVTGRGGP
jgi:hypothetical protein